LIEQDTASAMLGAIIAQTVTISREFISRVLLSRGVLFTLEETLGMATSSTPSQIKAKHPAVVAFGEAVRRRRRQQGFSQEAFGDACGIDRSYMGGIERGEHNLALINIMKIIRTLGVRPSEFFGDLDDVSGDDTAAK
jgi:hypothetical protein